MKHSMAVPRTQPLKLVSPEQMVERMNATFDAIARRAFEIFEGTGGRLGRDLEDWLQAEAQLIHPVHVEISETDEALTVRAEVPGFAEKNIQISLEPRVLTISGKRESAEEHKNGKTVYCEWCSNEIFRAVELPATVDTSSRGVAATCDKGVLTVTLPKLVEARPREIKIEAKEAGD